MLCVFMCVSVIVCEGGVHARTFKVEFIDWTVVILVMLRGNANDFIEPNT